MKKILVLTTVFMALLSNVFAQTLKADVEADKVPMGEVFYLNLSYDGKDGASLQPDLSGLQNDFTVYSTSSSSQMNYINGQSFQQSDWDIGLLPKHEGKVTIPAIKVGKYTSQPITIEVLPAGSTVAGVGKQGNVKNDNQLAEATKFSVDLEVDNTNPYIQQEVNAVLSIHDKIGLQLTSAPQFVNADNWLIKELKNYEVKNVNGERVIKFYYAMFPQKSGNLELPTAKINGFYISADNINKHPLLQQGFNSLFQFMSMDINDVFGTQKPVELYSKTAQINVLPEVADYGQNWWLPAENLKFEAMWTEKKPLFMVGETVAREIALTVLGVADTQLPELSFTDDKNFKLYPENPQFNTEVIKDKVVSQAVTRVVYIPQKNGEQILPELKLQWFNVRTKKIETAVIPAEKVFVEGHSVEPETKSMPAENTKTQVTEQKTEKTEITPQNLVSDEKIWIWVIAAFLAGLLISFLFRRPQTAEKKETKSRTDWKSIIRCNLNNKDYRALRDNLILWGNMVFKDANISNLQDLAKAVKQDNFENQLQNLNKILYGGENVSLDAVIILQAIKNSSGHKNKNEAEELLPKLYK